MLELSAATRERHLERMAEGVDVLIVGGGITGAGIALDAASRGLSVALVERHDFASGTSGRSTRLIHGGARYLQQGEVGLVYESLRERRLLLRRAPHLVRPLPFLVPARTLANRILFRSGLLLYDVLTAGRNIRRHRRVDKAEVARLAPHLHHPAPGYVYWDCQTDDARLVIEIVRQAAAFGAAVANRAEVTGFLGTGRISGATVRDTLTGSSFDVRAGVTVNATGAWAGAVHELASSGAPRLRPSKGIHLVFDRRRLPIRSAVVIPGVPEHGGLVVLIPWGPRVYAGTTDTPYDGRLETPDIDGTDVRMLLGSVQRAFAVGLTDDDVLASWAGVRPLLDAHPGHTRDLSRRHVVIADPLGPVTVTGGKLTTYRSMAEEVVDLACRRLGRGEPCRTSTLPLGLTRPLAEARDAAEAGIAALGLALGAGARLVARYGDDWAHAVSLIREQPELGQPVSDGLPVLRVELEIARTREMALDDDDVLVRRTRLALLGRDRARSGSSPAGTAGDG